MMLGQRALALFVLWWGAADDRLHALRPDTFAFAFAFAFALAFAFAFAFAFAVAFASASAFAFAFAFPFIVVVARLRVCSSMLLPSRVFITSSGSIIILASQSRKENI